MKRNKILLADDDSSIREVSRAILCLYFKEYEVEEFKDGTSLTGRLNGDNEDIALYGFSLSASAMLMSKQDINAVIADSAYADLEMMVEHVFSIFGPLKFIFAKSMNIVSKLFLGTSPRYISPANSIKDSKTAILVIHGSKDSQIPVENAYKLKASNPSIELWIVENADHGQAYALYRKAYEARIKDFLKKNME